jgi:hypothetical protein
VTRSFALATGRTMKNRILHQFRRLRQPRYLFSALAGLAYFTFVFVSQTRKDHPINSAMSVDIVAIMVLAVGIGAWIIPAMSALEFTEAEMHFLFGAPLSRARILQYKLIRSQPGMIIGVFVGIMFGLPQSGFVGMWAAYTAVIVYLMFVALARERLRERGIPAWMVGTIAFLFGVWVIWFLVRHGVTGGSDRARIFVDPAVQPLLAVPRFIAETLFLRSAGGLALHIAGLAAGAAVVFFLASRLRVNFNELVITASQRAAKWKGSFARADTRVTVKRFGPLFRLRPDASPETAIAWKNTIALVRISGPGILFAVIAYGFFVAVGPINELFMAAALPMCTIPAVFLPLTGAMMVKQDFRMDVMRLDVLKTYPLDGTRLVAAEIAAPVIAVSLLQLYMLAGLAILFSIQQLTRLPEFWPQALLLAFLFTVPVQTIQYVINNAVPILYPGWTAKPKDDMRGAAVVGQRILTLLANLIVLAIVLIPPAIVAAIGYFVTHRFARDSQLILALSTVPAIALLAAEAWLAVRILGAQYDRMDLARDLDPGMI